MEECAAESITPVQYSILTALEHMGTAEQIVLSSAVGLDTTNVADVLARLERQKMVKRRMSPRDKRMKVVSADRDRPRAIAADRCRRRARARAHAWPP